MKFLLRRTSDMDSKILTRTLRHGLSVCAPTILKPLPGVYFPPTAKAMIVDWFLVTKYCSEQNMQH